jgi:hypothetical protein
MSDGIARAFANNAFAGEPMAGSWTSAYMPVNAQYWRSP